MKIIFLLPFLFSCAVQLDLSFPGVPISPAVIEQARRAHRYMSKTLDDYEYRRASKYTLYLAIENYEEKLYQLKQLLLVELSNYIAGSRNLVLGKGNIILGSNNKLAGYNNWILTERQVTSKQIEENVLYFGKWRILLDKIPIIEYRPDYAIQNLDNQDQSILRNMRGVRDLRQFHERKHLRKLNRH